MTRWATTLSLLLLLGGLILPTNLSAQETDASVRGRVVDAQDQPLPGANVIAVHVPSGTRYGTSTGENGQYNLSGLRVGGPYRVTASFVGYQSKREEGIALSLGQALNLDFQLQEKTAELEEVEVVAGEGGILASEKAGVSTNISTAEIESQPTMSNALADITRLVPQSYVANDDDDGAAVSFAGQNTDFNSIYIDGAVANDIFGLSAQGTDGGQSGATPISLYALEAFDVDISPYGVTQSGFTGAAVNAVTKSGTNKFTGSFRFERRGNGLAEQSAAFTDNRYVGNFSGPIIEDKLFFFFNFDVRRSEEPQPLQRPFEGRSLDIAGTQGNNTLDGVDEIRSFVQENTGYDPGGFGTRSTTLNAEKYLGKLDYNINQNHRLTARYFFNGPDNVDQFQSTTENINFGNSAEVFPNTTHNAMLQWNGAFGNQVSTKNTFTFKSVEDDRGVRGEPFPHMTIEDGGPDRTIELGSEPFSQVNLLEQDVWTFDSQTDIYLGDHTLTVGTHNEYYDIVNKFAIFSGGLYNFGSPRDFAATICDYAQRNPNRTANGGPNDTCNEMFAPEEMEPSNLLLHGYSLVDDNPQTDDFESIANDNTNLAGAFNATRLAFYAQDRWQVNDRLQLTLGLRANLPKILDDPETFEGANSEFLSDISNFHDLEGARSGDVPDWRVMWEPRFGFNWDLFGDQSTKLRGGAGIFTSRSNLVWAGSMFTNNGVSSDFIVGINSELRRPENHITRPEPGETGFLVNPFGSGGTPPSEIVPTGNITLFANELRDPRVLRTSLGVDQELPFDLVGTLEAQFSNTLSDLVVENVNLRPPNETTDGPAQRPIWAYNISDDGPFISNGGGENIRPQVDDVLRVRNTARGHSYNVTATLRKQPLQVWSGGTFRGRFTYSYGDAFAVQSYGGDTVGSLWDDNEHINGTNNLKRSRSEFSQGHRIQFSANLRQEIADNFAVTTSLFYTGVSGRPFSYTIGSALDDAAGLAMIGDDGGSPLFRVPTSASQMTLSPITSEDGTVLRSVAEQRADLEQFISNVDYLDTRRGQFTHRNSDRTPFEGVLDLRLRFDVFGELLNRGQSLAVNLNVFNFSALAGETFDGLGLGFGEDWGDRFIGEGSFSVVNFAGFKDPNGNDDNPENDFVPVFESGLGSEDGRVIREKEDIFTKRTTGSTFSSQYQVKVGVEYTF